MSYIVKKRNAGNRPVEGFTLVETLVSIGLFLIVVSIAMSAIVSIYAVGSRVNNTAGVSDSLEFMLNDLVRAARLSVLYNCGLSANDGSVDNCVGSSLSFKPRLLDNSDGPTITYALNGATNAIEKTIEGDPPSQLTSGELTIESFTVRVFDALAGDEKPSRVLVTVEGTFAKGTNEEVTYRYQTTVTQRVLE